MLNGGGAEHPRSEGWSFPCLFCGTQVTRVVAPPPLKLLESLLTVGLSNISLGVGRGGVGYWGH